MNNIDLEEKKSCFISTGEVSADLIGAELVTKIKKEFVDLNIFGIGGEAMIAAGLQSIVDQKELRFMGFADAIKNIFKIKKILNYILKEISKRKVEFAILIDYPGFHFKLAQELKKRGIKVFQYISPKVWAWGKGRIKRLERDFDAVFGVFPFEIEFFKNTNVNYIYVGSFHKKRIDNFIKNDGNLNIKIDPRFGRKLALLPGSRRTEFKENFSLMFNIQKKLKEKVKDLVTIIPIASGFEVSDLVKHLDPEDRKNLNLVPQEGGSDVWEDKVNGIYFIKEHSLNVIYNSDVALVVEGTATLETALLRVPFAAIYNPGFLLTFIGKRILKLSNIGLDSIVLGKKIHEDFIKYFTVEEVSEELYKLLTVDSYKNQMIEKFNELHCLLEKDGADIISSIKEIVYKT